jgi:uncharacterized repeat protein (TIGR01451 family)
MKTARTVLLLFGSIAALGVLVSQPLPGRAPLFQRPAEVETDQADYPPGSTAYIIGSGFLPKETVSLQVLHADGTPSDGADHEPWSVRADSRGEFASSWHVCEDDCLGALLELTAVGQRSGRIAQAQFTDGPSASNGQLLGWLDLTQQWGSTIQSANSRYGEGDTIPLRFNVSLAAGTTHTLLLKYDFSTDNVHYFFDSLGSYNASVRNADPAAGLSGLGTPTQKAIPADLALLRPAAQVPGVLTAYNVSSLNFGATYTLVNGVKSILLTFTVAPGTGSKNVVIAYGGHLASEAIWGTGNGASQFPGASTKAYVSLDNSADLNVSVNPGAIVGTADISLSKSVSPTPLFSGNSLTYHLVAVNNGPDAATSVVVTDPLPAGTTLASASASQGTFSGTTTLSFALGTINPNASASITVIVNVGATTTGLISNTASVSSATIDPNTANNTATATTTRDTTPPVITCPADITVPTAAGQCSAAVTYTVTATDANSVPSILCNPPSGATFPKGTNVVVCTGTDSVGNASSCSFRVIVQDTEKPALGACPGAIVRANDPGQCGAVITFSAPTATDNCPGPVSVVCVPASGSAFALGTTQVTCTATDAAGNHSSCSFPVTVQDKEGPRITCPKDIVVPTDAGACQAIVSFATPAAVDQCPGTVAVVCSPPSGSAFPIGVTAVTCTATDAAGNQTQCVFTVTVQDASNISWPQALPLTLADSQGIGQAAFQECITAADQSRWFKFKVQPGSRVIVTLTGLPANYDLVLFKDIAAAFVQLTSQQDLLRLNAQFASDAFSPAAFSSDAFSPAAFSPAAFSPAAFSPAAFSPAAFSPAAFSPAAFSPAAFSPDSFAPAAFSPAAFSSDAFSPAAFSPAAFSPAAFSPAAFSSAQIQSVIGVSAFDGVDGEGIIANTWDNSGDFYVRVRGRNGVFSLGAPFQLQVYLITGACGSVSAVPVDSQSQPLPPSTVAAPAAGYKTIILTDLNRMLGSGTSQEKTDLLAELSTFAARPEVKGVVMDVGSDPWVSFFNTQADTYFDCPFAKNLVGTAIKDIVDRSRAGNALEYVVIIGNDRVIPYFRYPDEALLGSEKNYVPPVKDFTASQASLRLGYVLGQDEYGARCNVSLKSTTIPIPDLAVGRLVESAAEVKSMLDAYLETSSGVVATPASALVTGYDFLQDVADAVRLELQAGMARTADALILDHSLPPTSPSAWTADDLRAQLLGQRHDLIFLAGHFSSVAALASDYSTHMLSSELAGSTLNLKNAVLFSAGCHSGYNVVDPDGIPFVTQEPDWAQACARKQITFLGGTGYQYGDTDFIEYSERIYLEFTRQLRSGSGAIPVGKALARAKQVYLNTTPQFRGIHQKAYLEATLFGLPMLSVNMPGARLAASADQPVVGSTQAFATNPGATLGLTYADLTVTPALTAHSVTLTNPDDNSTVTATYLSGGAGLVNNPAEPILPLEVRNVTVPATVLRGVGFRGGSFTDVANVVPLTAAATTEIRGVHAAFVSDVFYPIKPWQVNYFDGLCGGVNGNTRLMALPAQFISNAAGGVGGTFREYQSMNFRLFYSGNTTTYVDANAGVSSTPALAAAPSISGVAGVTVGSQVLIAAHVTGNPAAGIQSVWVTYTAQSGPYAGQWRPLDLVQSATDSTLWQATLPLNGTSPDLVRFMVHAVNGVGLVAVDAKQGAYYAPDETDDIGGAPTVVTVLSAPVTGPYGTLASFSARLTANGSPLAGRRLRFSLGDQDVRKLTDANGAATVTLNLLTVPGSYQLKASFAGGGGYAASFVTSPFTITKQITAIALTGPGVCVQPTANSHIVATLQDAAGHYLVERTVFFIVTGPNGSYTLPNITDYIGRAELGPVPLPSGTYSVVAYFGGAIPLPPPNAALHLVDERYVSSVSTPVTLLLDGQKPVLNCPSGIVAGTDPGKATAVVPFTVTATDNCSSATVVCTPASGSIFPLGSTTVNCSATDVAGNQATCSFTVTVKDTEGPKITGLTASPSVLRPPNHQMVLVTLTATATDNAGTPVCKITSASSNEPVNGIGDGDQEPDWIIAGDLTVYLRSERAETGTGRIYTIVVTCTDAAGNSASKSVTVSVPR